MSQGKRDDGHPARFALLLAAVPPVSFATSRHDTGDALIVTQRGCCHGTRLL